jgi:hypothetical protein
MQSEINDMSQYDKEGRTYLAMHSGYERPDVALVCEIDADEAAARVEWTPRAPSPGHEGLARIVDKAAALLAERHAQGTFKLERLSICPVPTERHEPWYFIATFTGQAGNTSPSRSHSVVLTADGEVVAPKMITAKTIKEMGIGAGAETIMQ